MYWSGLWALTVIEHSLFWRDLGRICLLNLKVILYGNFVSIKEIYLSYNINKITFIVRNVFFEITK